MKITIMRDQLVAALCTSAKADVRYYLNGIYLEATNTETRLTSTDGRVMALLRADAKGDNEVEGTVRMIVPFSAIEKIKKHKVYPTIEINDDGGSWGVVDINTRTSFTPIDGRFPDVRRVLPSKPSEELAQINPELIAMFAKAAVALGKKPDVVHVIHNGDGAALVTFEGSTDYVGALSPLNPEKISVAKSAPAWATSELTADIEELV